MSWTISTQSVCEPFEREPSRPPSRPWVSDFERLERSGARLPPPEVLDDERLTAKLWEVIGRLAGLGIFLAHTDHLSDRELYAQLWHELLREETPDSFDELCECWWSLDLVGQGSEEQLGLWLRHYATEAERAEWALDFPDDARQPREKPPYDRDRFLPAPPAEPGAGGG